MSEETSLVIRVGTQIYGLSNAVNSTSLSIEAGIDQADRLLKEIRRRSKVEAVNAPLILEVAGSWWAVQATSSSSKTEKDAVDKAISVVVDTKKKQL
jgi:hypothetical protein